MEEGDYEDTKHFEKTTRKISTRAFCSYPPDSIRLSSTLDVSSDVIFSRIEFYPVPTLSPGIFYRPDLALHVGQY